MQTTVTGTSGPSATIRFLILLTVALLGGGLAGIAVVKLGDFFTYPPEIAEVLDSLRADLDYELIDNLERQMLVKNTTLCATVSGLLVVGLLGLATGMMRSWPAAVLGIAMGLIMGAVCGAVGGFAGAATWQYLIDHRYLINASGDTTTHSAIANSIVWAFIGAGTGAVASLRGRRFSSTIAGLCGGLLGAGLLMLIVGLVLPSANTSMPIPKLVVSTSWVIARLLWAIIPATLIGLLIARSSVSPTGQPREEPANDTSV